MIKFWLSSFFLLSTICNIKSANTVNFVLATDYKWFCQGNRNCLRVTAANNNTVDKLYDTQNICRLACGQYRSLFPHPTGAFSLGKEVVEFNPYKIKFDLVNVPSNATTYVKAISRIFKDNVLKECQNCSRVVANDFLIKFSIASDSLTLSWETDESYAVNVEVVDDNVKVQITAPTVFGARHGLETVSQLIATKLDNTEPETKLYKTVILNAATIKDSPIFPHRGLMLDTSRNFIPVPRILATLNGMGASKLNTFHWHATDSHSFPIEIRRVPQMTRYGAYSSSMIYSKEDILYIYEYAKQRGIRVILELDAPSHASNGWQWGPSHDLGNLAVCINEQPWRGLCIQPPCGQLNPANDNLYKVLRDIYSEFVDWFPPGEVLHMGGDEVFFNCWNSSSEIISLLNGRGYGREDKDFLQLWAEFQAASLRIWDEVNGQTSCSRELCEQPSPVILWTSHLTEPESIEKYLQKDRYVIQTWVESSSTIPTDLLLKGFRVILSTKNAWYLDHGFWGVTRYYSWRMVYNNRIPKVNGVLGGEACMWTEYVDENSVDSRIWPRAAAVAERLWSNPGTDASLAEARFYRQRERLISRGLKTDSVTPKWCVLNEGGCS